jgi:6,7-dimethyl-8-ribityllumazine synthase
MSDSFDESQDWPLRDYSARLRPPRPHDEQAAAEPESEPAAAAESEPEEGPSFDPPPASSSTVEVLYDEDELDAGAPAVEEDEEARIAPETPEAEAAPAEAAPVEPEPVEPESAEPEPVEPEPVEPEPVEPEPVEPEPVEPPTDAPMAEAPPEEQHAEGELRIPGGYSVLEGAPNGQRRTAAVVVSKFNGEITDKLLDSALGALDEAGVARDAVLVMPVPGAFELPIAAMALAKTRRYSCVIALGCVIRGETPHFDFVASEAASGLQLAGIETGVPVSFGLLTCDTAEQAEARVDRGAWAARTALEMADAFAQLRTAVARG